MPKVYSKLQDVVRAGGSGERRLFTATLLKVITHREIVAFLSPPEMENTCVMHLFRALTTAPRPVLDTPDDSSAQRAIKAECRTMLAHAASKPTSLVVEEYGVDHIGRLYDADNMYAATHDVLMVYVPLGRDFAAHVINLEHFETLHNVQRGYVLSNRQISTASPCPVHCHLVGADHFAVLLEPYYDDVAALTTKLRDAVGCIETAWTYPSAEHLFKTHVGMARVRALFKFVTKTDAASACLPLRLDPKSPSPNDTRRPLESPDKKPAPRRLSLERDIVAENARLAKEVDRLSEELALSHRDNDGLVEQVDYLAAELTARDDLIYRLSDASDAEAKAFGQMWSLWNGTLPYSDTTYVAAVESATTVIQRKYAEVLHELTTALVTMANMESELQCFRSQAALLEPPPTPLVYFGRPAMDAVRSPRPYDSPRDTMTPYMYYSPQ
ncbi:hypothetical protein SPRG_07973 [Saprolegnia parasitica CBS 223.65]|uniref:Uncharacterized protein n=1 Tax=Saprolegnia parasitica (strain CBS 223.65) TaxID=695850 RepID=A0A067C720_SAPPC|nr:hypothetical protein SPRG_07973 [Saprolegnia parasitica CBS 223.65]KDO26569.1 hypothetical protein SPRG_07973 [Saprolegnia parasitica CBS 223.65]|eukprot:XP_012202711.1 hypothetical protein SPRG_07973 [Saprolegnia parasitica CBS 223.65]